VPPTAFGALGQQLFLDLGLGQDLVERLVQALDHRRGVRAGTNIAYQLSTSKSATPDSCMVGTWGKAALRLSVETASAFSLPALTC
jgi:hypothetical protein